MDVFAAIAVSGFILLRLLLWAWDLGTADKRLHRWARQAGYCLVSCEYRPVLKWPFLRMPNLRQMVYRITVRDRRGNVKTGRARTGGWFLALLSDEVDVRW